MTEPNAVTGASREAIWLERLRQFCRSLQILPGIGYKVRRTPSGTVLEILPGGGAPISISTWKFESAGQDYIMCRPWDGTKVDMSGSATAIAMPDSLRGTLATERIDGIVWTYTYNAPPNQRRTAAGSGITEAQVITPRYVPYELQAGIPSTDPTYGTLGAFKGSTIWAISCTTFALDQAGASIGLMDTNRAGRAWAAES